MVQHKTTDSFAGDEENCSPAEPQYYVWTDALACGHDDIDADHRHLFALAERLWAAGKVRHDGDATGEALRQLVEYVQHHFIREEALMRAVDYPNYADHRFEHELFTGRVLRHYRDFTSGKPLSHKALSQFLRRWLRYHILNSDMHLSAHVRNTRAKPGPL